MLDRIAAIIERSAQGKGPLRPTTIFNEGWMLALVLDAAARRPGGVGFIQFTENADWYAEALLASPFAPRHRGDPLGEGRTHADAVVGQFTVGNVGKGDFFLTSNAQQFLVIEAKMFSGLSLGTLRAAGYDQAARNVACMAKALQLAGIQPERLSDLTFAVVAPGEQIDKEVFGDLVTHESIKAKVEDRMRDFEAEKDHWYKDWFVPTLDAITLRLAPWEELVQPLGHEYVEFYSRCLEYNRSGV